MASSITLKVGNLTSTINFTATDANVAARLRRLAARTAPLPDNITNQAALDQATQEVVKVVLEELTRMRHIELQSQQTTNLYEQAQQESQL